MGREIKAKILSRRQKKEEIVIAQVNSVLR